jgi:hypothetical protein
MAAFARRGRLESTLVVIENRDGQPKDALPILLHIDNRPAFRLGFVERLVQPAKR